MQHCGKHDITGETCWNCEEAGMSKEERENNYSDPAFLAKRGGAAGQQVILSNAMHKLSQLSPEHLANLISLAKGEPSKRQMIVSAA